MGTPSDSLRSRRRRRPGARPWQLALGGALLFGLTSSSIYWLARRPAPAGPPRVAAPALVQPVQPATAPASPHALPADRLQHMVDEMTQRVKADPRDASAWALLAHSDDLLGRFDDSVRAYERLSALRPDDAQVLADYADALAVAQGRSFTGRPQQLLQRALALDPQNVKALLLAGTEAFARQAYGEAVERWARARALAGDPAMQAQLDSGLAEARALQGRVAAASAPGLAPGLARGITPAAAGRTVVGRVSLAPALAAQANPDDTVFVFARSTLGSRMPVALLRRRVRDLPLEFRLDDSMAMVPEVRLSALASVVVGARVSRRGDAVPQPGDLQGFSAPVAVGSQGVRVEIAEVLP